MPSSKTECEVAVVNYFIAVAAGLGVPRSLAAIYGVCFVGSAPLSFQEIQTKLGISKGSVSQGLRTLCTLGALKKIDSGSRNALYSPDMSLRGVASTFLRHKISGPLKTGANQLATLDDALATFSDADSLALRSRVQVLRSWHEKLLDMLPIVDAFITQR